MNVKEMKQDIKTILKQRAFLTEVKGDLIYVVKEEDIKLLL
jgi:hypothetical protein